MRTIAIPSVEMLMRLDERNMIAPPRITDIHRFFFSLINSPERPELVEEAEKGLKA